MIYERISSKSVSYSIRSEVKAALVSIQLLRSTFVFTIQMIEQVEIGINMLKKSMDYISHCFVSFDEFRRPYQQARIGEGE